MLRAAAKERKDNKFLHQQTGCLISWHAPGPVEWGTPQEPFYFLTAQDLKKENKK